MTNMKNFADETILEAWEYCVINHGDCDDCSYKGDLCAVGNKDIIKIIHRLRAENESLRRTQSSNVELFKKNAEQKAEIERLTKQIAMGERVDETSKSTISCLSKENAELQKQVDELKEERDVFKRLFEFCNNSSITTDEIINTMNSFYREQAEQLAELKVKQAVKDTAKQIITWLTDMYERGMIRPFNMILSRLKERYGVEVE